MSRKAPVDEILFAAEHLDGCFDCRDRAAALVDDGTGDRPHGRRRSIVNEVLPNRHRVLFWSVMAVIVVAIAALLILYRP